MIGEKSAMAFLSCAFAMASFVCTAGQKDVVDPRVRTFVHPKRIVWCTSAQKAEGEPENALSAVEKTALLLTVNRCGENISLSLSCDKSNACLCLLGLEIL